MKRLFLVCCLLLPLLAHAAERRIALVVGNDSYRNIYAGFRLAKTLP